MIVDVDVVGAREIAHVAMIGEPRRQWTRDQRVDQCAVEWRTKCFKHRRKEGDWPRRVDERKRLARLESEVRRGARDRFSAEHAVLKVQVGRNRMAQR